MPTIRGQFAQLLAPGLAEVMFEWLKEHPEEYSQFLNVSNLDGAFDEDQVVAGLGLARQKLENEPITYDDPIQGGTKRYIAESYALGWMVSREMLDDDKYRIMRQIPGELMKSCRQTWEQVGANILNLGFTTVTTADGLALFSTVHDLLGGGTYSNLLNPASDLSITAMQDISILAENVVNERGLKMRLSVKDLWIPPELQWTAKEILGSSLKPYTANNEINVMEGSLTPHVLHYLTDTQHWFVSCDKHYAKFRWRAKPITESADDFDTKGSKHSIFFRCVAGATHWNGWFGSNP